LLFLFKVDGSRFTDQVTTQSPQTAATLPQCSSSYKGNQPSDAFGPTSTREVNTWLEACYFKVCNL